MEMATYLIGSFMILGLSACGDSDRGLSQTEVAPTKLSSDEINDSELTARQKKQQRVIQQLNDLLQNKKNLGECRFEIGEQGVINPQFIILNRDGTKQYISVVISPELTSKHSPAYGGYLRLEEEYGIVYNPAVTGQGARTIDFYLDDAGQVASIVGRKWTKILGVWKSEKLITCQGRR